MGLKVGQTVKIKEGTMYSWLDLSRNGTVVNTNKDDHQHVKDILVTTPVTYGDGWHNLSFDESELEVVKVEREPVRYLYYNPKRDTLIVYGKNRTSYSLGADKSKPVSFRRLRKEGPEAMGFVKIGRE